MNLRRGRSLSRSTSRRSRWPPALGKLFQALIGSLRILPSFLPAAGVTPSHCECAGGAGTVVLLDGAVWRRQQPRLGPALRLVFTAIGDTVILLTLPLHSY